MIHDGLQIESAPAPVAAGSEGEAIQPNIHEGEDPIPTVPNTGRGHIPSSTEVLATLDAGRCKVAVIDEREVGRTIKLGSLYMEKPILVRLERVDSLDEDGQPEPADWAVCFVKDSLHDTELRADDVPQLIEVLTELHETYQSMTRTVRRDETTIRDAADYREDLS